MEMDTTMREMNSSRNNTQTRSILKTRTNMLNRPIQSTCQDKEHTKQSNWENESSVETEQHEIKSQRNKQVKEEISFKERMQAFDNRKKKNAVSIAMQVLASEKAECTFAPKINSPSKRNFKCFLKEQQDFLEKKANRLNLTEKEFSKTPSKLNLNETVMLTTKGKGCAMLEILEKSTPRQPRNTLFKCRSTKGIKTIKQARQELESKRQKEKLEREKSKRRNNVLKQRISREIDTLLDKHNTKGSPITFPVLCIQLLTSYRQHIEWIRDDKKWKR
jgi:hypothetical protein